MSIPKDESTELRAKSLTRKLNACDIVSQFKLSTYELLVSLAEINLEENI